LAATIDEERCMFMFTFGLAIGFVVGVCAMGAVAQQLVLHYCEPRKTASVVGRVIRPPAS